MIWRRDGSKGDVYYYAPSGVRLRSRPEVAKYLETVEDPEMAPEYDQFCFKSPPIGQKGRYPAINSGAVSELLSDMWDELSEAERNKFEEDADDAFSAYNLVSVHTTLILSKLRSVRLKNSGRPKTQSVWWESMRLRQSQ